MTMLFPHKRLGYLSILTFNVSILKMRLRGCWLSCVKNSNVLDYLGLVWFISVSF